MLAANAGDGVGTSSVDVRRPRSRQQGAGICQQSALVSPVADGEARDDVLYAGGAVRRETLGHLAR